MFYIDFYIWEFNDKKRGGCGIDKNNFFSSLSLYFCKLEFFFKFFCEVVGRVCRKFCEYLVIYEKWDVL